LFDTKHVCLAILNKNLFKWRVTLLVCRVLMKAVEEMKKNTTSLASPTTNNERMKINMFNKPNNIFHFVILNKETSHDWLWFNDRWKNLNKIYKTIFNNSWRELRDPDDHWFSDRDLGSPVKTGRKFDQLKLNNKTGWTLWEIYKK